MAQEAGVLALHGERRRFGGETGEVLVGAGEASGFGQVPGGSDGAERVGRRYGC